jgi:hypothetical protein
MLSRHLSVTIACLLGAVLALGACGGGTKNASAKKASGSATTSTTAGDRRAAIAAFRSCMADHGITLPDRGAGGGQGGPSFPQGGPPTSSSGGGRGFRQAPAGVDQAKYDAARQACQDKLPQGGFGGGGDPAARSARDAYRRCLADHGVQVPTTVTNTPGPRPTINRDDPAFAAADQVCRPLLPTTTTTPAAPQGQ